MSSIDELLRERLNELKEPYRTEALKHFDNTFPNGTTVIPVRFNREQIVKLYELCYELSNNKSTIIKSSLEKYYERIVK